VETGFGGLQDKPMRYLHRLRVRLKDLIGGFRTDWSRPDPCAISTG